MLNSSFHQEQCDNDEAYIFLLLLANPSQRDAILFKPMTEEDWTQEVKRSKKSSTLSIF